MTKPRNTVNYELKDGKKVVYIGSTNNPERREKEHQGENKNFTHMNIISRQMTKDGAKAKEEERLATYRKGHGGKNPKYNKDSDG